MKTKITLVALCSAFALTACVDPYAYDDPNARTKQGVAVGALAGAALGASSGSDKLAKAAAGAVVGGIVGGAIGASFDQQAAELRSQLSSGITVTNHGDYLTINMPDALLFATDSDRVTPRLTRDLQTVAASLQRHSRTNITVVGHTDSTGSAAYNMDLSRRRASSVASILQANGVSPSRVAVVGRGEEQPIASNLTVDGRAQNRRVEIVIRPLPS